MAAINGNGNENENGQPMASIQWRGVILSM